MMEKSFPYLFEFVDKDDWWDTHVLKKIEVNKNMGNEKRKKSEFIDADDIVTG